MTENLPFLNLSNKFVKHKENNFGKKEEGQYDLQSFSTTSSSSNTIDSFSNESIKNSNQVQKIQKISKIFIPKNILLNLNKTGRNTLKSYLNKLINKNLLISSRKKFNNIFIFDWDDTLICTSILSPYGYFDDEMEVESSKMEKIEKLEIYVNKLLSKAIEKGDTYIITNSEAAWVEYSCERFFPKVYNLLSKIKIISARDLYEEKYPHDYKTWKMKAFNNIIKYYSLNIPTNIVSFGDSSYEIDATYDLSSKFTNGIAKFIKFKEYPSIDDLIEQIKLTLEKFSIFYSKTKNWTINIFEEK